MSKTLEEAIGCYTVSEDGLQRHVWLLNKSLISVRRRTKSNKPRELLAELHLMQERTKALYETLKGATDRCFQIIEGKEIQ